jgi:DNA-directed RNA polymerase alpha subunit
VAHIGPFHFKKDTIDFFYNNITLCKPVKLRKGKMKNDQQNLQESDLPSGLAQPAQRALASAGIQRLEQLSQFSENEVKKMHGIGPRALDQLRSALAEKGLAFAKK